MPELSELGDLLVSCRVITRDQWETAASSSRGDLRRLLDHISKTAPYWWEGSAHAPAGLTEYQRDIIESRFNDDELELLRRDLALNSFLLLDKLGHGGQGEVYRARQLNPPRYAAVKVLIRDTESRRRRFEQEARAMIRIQHPAVARFYLYERIRGPGGQPTNEYLIAMEFVKGTDLQQLVRRVGPVPLDFALRWLSELLEGLALIHQKGFIHRDIKPENVMIIGPPPGPDILPEETAAKLLDFGAAKQVDDEADASATAGLFVGTIEYAAPEQWQGKIELASDLYALGGTLFYMLTGRHPYKKDRRDPLAYRNAHLREEVPNILAHNPKIPPEVNDLCQKMMAKDHRERGAAAELLEDIRRLRYRESEPAPPPPVALPRASLALPPPPSRPVPIKRKDQVENPLSRAADPVLGLLERLFIPADMRPRHGDELPFQERVTVLLRRPLVLLILLVLAGLVIYLVS
jgi:serine/threonine protein kinase